MCNQEELMAYLDGEASAGVAEHLEGCGDCQTLAAELKGVSARLMAWEVEPPSAGLDRRIRAALAPEKKVSVRRWWPWALGTAGVLAVAFVAIFPAAKHELAPRATLAPIAKTAEDELPAPGAKGKLPGPPMIARTAQIALTTIAFDKARATLDDILRRHQGYFGNVNLTAPDNIGRTLEATLRVPAAQLDAALAEVRKLGRVLSESQSGEEVTAQYVDLEARLANARHTEERLTDLLRQRTGDLADVLAVEKELDNTRGEIERMEAEEKALTNRVDYANLTVTVTEGATARPDSTFSRLRDAASDGFRSLAAGAIGVALLLLAWGPSIVVSGGLLYLIWWGVRRFVRRRP
jgi:Domain of unknown function (DUF4349)